MNPVVCDVETTIFQKGNVYAACNRLCYAGLHWGSGSLIHSIDLDDAPYGGKIDGVRSHLERHDLFIAFNLKFDWNWLRRYGVYIPTLPVWDLQTAEFIITAQASAMPSLEGTLEKYCLGKKGTVDEEYWSQGIDTPLIPRDEMVAYLESDLLGEWALWEWQLEYLKDKPALKRLIWRACQDLKTTAEMEWNGLKYDLELSTNLGNEKLARIEAIDNELREICGRTDLSFSSGDDVSLYLYGGVRYDLGWETYVFTYKDGHTAEKQRRCKVPVTFQRMVEPLKGTELKKHGFYSTDVGTLQKLKATGATRKAITLLLERSRIETQVSRYLHGIPKLYEEMQWENGIIHGQLNHCVAKTGRLSSSKPNQQNLDQETRKCIVTRYVD